MSGLPASWDDELAAAHARGECTATLEHGHGISRCNLKPDEHDTPGDPRFDTRKPGQHSAICGSCAEDDGIYDSLHWVDPTNGHTPLKEWSRQNRARWAVERPKEQT